MTTITCHFRDRRECACCDAPECGLQKPMVVTAPVIRVTLLQQFAVMFFLTCFFSVFGYAALSRADHSFKTQDLVKQESSVHVARR